MEELGRWLAAHPTPDDPVLGLGAGLAPGFASSSELTPRQIVEAVRLQSPQGEFVVRMLEVAIRRHSLEEVLASFAEEGRNQEALSASK